MYQFSKIHYYIVENNTHCPYAIDGCTARCTGFRKSLMIRKRLEECFGWIKTVGGAHKSQFVGKKKMVF